LFRLDSDAGRTHNKHLSGRKLNQSHAAAANITTISRGNRHKYKLPDEHGAASAGIIHTGTSLAGILHSSEYVVNSAAF
jgi:hypothetical protein